GGSKNDLPEQGPALAALFNTVDSFDTHATIPEYHAALDQAARPAGKTAMLSVGWDPGLFSLNRLYGEAILPVGATYTFWGKGLSQGHSDAVRRVSGVKAGVQYTIPAEEAIERVRDGELPELSTREKHKCERYVVLDDGAEAARVEQAIVSVPHYLADYATTVTFITEEELRRDHAAMPAAEVEQAIVSMPHYFADYDTTVTFITEEELRRDHAAMPHGGVVIRSGTSAAGTTQVMEYTLKLGSHPEFTAALLVAYARATWRLNQQGVVGAQTVLDVAPALLSPKSPEQ